MEAVLAIFHILVALLLIFFVLVQDTKGGAMGGMLGGGSGSNTLFGATGAASFLVKLTRWLAVVFAVTCIMLSIQSTNKTKSVTDSYVPAAGAEAPAANPAESTDKK